MTELSYQNVQEMIGELIKLFDKTGDFINGYENNFLDTSQAAREFETFVDKESVKTVYAQGSILIEVSADHLMALNKVLSEQAQTIASWTCTRSILEASALSAWLFNPQITIQERVQRSFAFRYEGLRQQSKFGDSIGQTSDVLSVNNRIQDVENKAISLGYSPVQDRRGRRIGIGQQMPSITELVNLTLNRESMYRLLSAFAHAHPWAMQQGSFEIASDGSGIFAEKSLSAISVAALCSLGASSFAHSVWFKTLLFGWDIDKLREIFQASFDTIPIPPEERFWKNS